MKVDRFIGIGFATLLVAAQGLSLPSAQAQGKSPAVNAQRFAVLMDGPITFDESVIRANLYSFTSGALLGQTTRGEGCLSIDPPNPFAPPCPNPPVLLPGQFYYEDYVVTFTLPGGTIQGSLKGYEVFNSNPPVHGGDRCAAAVEEGVVTGGTGRYARASGSFSSRISDEFKFIEEFGLEVPFWFNQSVVIFDLK